jgi:hypothetical protein
VPLTFKETPMKQRTFLRIGRAAMAVTWAEGELKRVYEA